MSDTKTTIELNGKLYNSATGEVLSAPTAPATPRPSTMKSIDGVSRPLPNQVKAHPTQKTQTLMRSAVKKPEPAVATPVASPIQLPASINSGRLERAQNINRSPMVKRFGVNRKTIGHKLGDIQVQPAPAHAHHHDLTPVHVPPTEPPLPESIKTQIAPKNGSQLFTAALNKMDSNTMPAALPALPAHGTPDKPKGFKIAGVAATVVVAVMVVGFGFYQNISAVSVRVANFRAGFHATLPNYAPSGFSLNKAIRAVPGQVTLNFLNGDHHYEIVQQPSSWTSQSLLDNYVSGISKGYKAVQASGKTVYVYGNTATWVNGGVWYTVAGNANLSTQQLVNIANSI